MSMKNVSIYCDKKIAIINVSRYSKTTLVTVFMLHVATKLLWINIYHFLSFNSACTFITTYFFSCFLFVEKWNLQLELCLLKKQKKRKRRLRLANFMTFHEFSFILFPIHWISNIGNILQKKKKKKTKLRCKIKAEFWRGFSSKVTKKMTKLKVRIS